jgi:hypothetical protein
MDSNSPERAHIAFLMRRGELDDCPLLQSLARVRVHGISYGASCDSEAPPLRQRDVIGEMRRVAHNLQHGGGTWLSAIAAAQITEWADALQVQS